MTLKTPQSTASRAEASRDRGSRHLLKTSEPGISLPPPECKVYTPEVLADAMVSAIDPLPHDCWLDPCIGPGAFIAALRRNGLAKERIVAVDIDSAPSTEDAAANTRRGVDFFEWGASTRKRFTKIIANPPYVALCKLAAELQARVQRFSDSDDPSFAMRSNYWCAFLAACLRLLKPDGSLAFVLPAAWDYALYAAELRDRVLKSFRCVEVHRSLEPLFPDVREGSVVLIAKGYMQEPETATRIDHQTAASLVRALTHPLPESTGTNLHASTSANSMATRFDELFTVSIGCVTGDVDFFLLTESQRLEFGLPANTLRPIVSKARHLTAAQMTKLHWDRLKHANERVWLFWPDDRSLKSEAVRAYLQHGEKTCNLNSYKLRNRDPWYQVPGIKSGIGFMSGMTRLGPWMSLRSMRGLAATNTLYVVTAKRAMSVDEQAAWALSLLSSETRHQVQAQVRRYSDGLAKLEPHDISGLRLFPPKRIEGSLVNYQRAIKLLLSGNPAGAVALADESVRRGQANRAETVRGGP